MKEKKARELIEKSLLGEATVEEERELSSLLQASPELQEEKEELEALIYTLRALRVGAPSDFLKKMRVKVRREERYINLIERKLKYAVLVASIVLVLLAGIFSFLGRKTPVREITEMPGEAPKGYIMQIEPPDNGGIHSLTVSEDNSM